MMMSNNKPLPHKTASAVRKNAFTKSPSFSSSMFTMMKLKRRRGVHFDGTTCKNDETKMNLMNQKKSLLFKGKVALTLDQINGNCSSDSNQNQVPQQQQQRRQRIMNHIDQILDVQLKQWEQSKKDPESLATVSRKLSHESQLDALARGQKDEKCVIKYCYSSSSANANFRFGQ